MGDRTYGTFELIACPPEHAAAVRQVIDDYGLVPNEPADGFIVLGLQYTEDEMSCGASSEIASTLAELDGVAFTVSEDPKYEWLGEIHWQLPDGRRGRCDADADQNPVLRRYEFDGIARTAAENGTDLQQAIRRYFDADVADEFDRWAQALDVCAAMNQALRLVAVTDDDEGDE